MQDLQLLFQTISCKVCKFFEDPKIACNPNKICTSNVMVWSWRRWIWDIGGDVDGDGVLEEMFMEMGSRRERETKKVNAFRFFVFVLTRICE